MGERVYLPQVGRFLQTDPVEGGSANDYDYCNADPINCTDLDGRKASDYNWSWTGSSPFTREGKVVGRVSVSLSVSLNGRQVRVTQRIKVLSGAVKIFGKRITCREEHFPFDNSCGSRATRGSFYLRDDANYHIDFSHIADGLGLLIAFTKTSPQFSCRKGRTAACKFN